MPLEWKCVASPPAWSMSWPPPLRLAWWQHWLGAVRYALARRAANGNLHRADRAADGRRACARSVTGLISAAAPHAPPSGCAAPLVEELFASRLRPALRRAAFAVSCNDASWLASRSCEAAKAGGRGWDRTSDPYDVNVVLSR